MAKFIVDRRMWYRGKGPKDSRLLREDGMRCCIGFVGQQCGIADVGLVGRTTIETASHLEDSWPEWMMETGKSTDIAKAYRYNDDHHLTDAERETQLKQIFARHDDEIEFVN